MLKRTYAGWVALALVCLGCTTAAADKTVFQGDDERATLPSGLVLEQRERTSYELIVRRGKNQAKVFEASRRPAPRGLGMRVAIRDDGGINVEFDWGGRVSFRPRELEARLDVASSAKQSRTAAITTLEHALTLDPMLWSAARELAVRRIAQHRPDLAATVIATNIKRNGVLAGYEHLVNDAGIRSLLDQPAIVALRAPKPGELRSETIGRAWSATLGVVAVEVTISHKTSEGDGGNTKEQFIAFQAVDADRLLELGMSTPADRAEIDRLLRDFDFRNDPAEERAPDVDTALEHGSNSYDALAFHNAQLNVKFSAGPISVLRDGKVIPTAACSLNSITTASWLPSASVLIVLDRSGDRDELCAIRVPR